MSTNINEEPIFVKLGHVKFLSLKQRLLYHFIVEGCYGFKNSFDVSNWSWNAWILHYIFTLKNFDLYLTVSLNFSRKTSVQEK